jgi:segregation and condensation protein B
MNHQDRIPVIEAILFAAGFPVKYERIAETCEITVEELSELLDSEAFAYEGRGIRLVRFSDSCQLCTNEAYERQVKAALGMRSGGALSNSALEVLAIVAYNQPVTKPFIEQVRGVDSSYAVTTLCEKQLIEVVGRLDVPGKPNLYGTTETFLRCFGLASLEELPKNEVLEVVASAEEGSGETPTVPSAEATLPTEPALDASEHPADSVPTTEAAE